jgi:hypothetical protein
MNIFIWVSARKNYDVSTDLALSRPTLSLTRFSATQGGWRGLQNFLCCRQNLFLLPSSIAQWTIWRAFFLIKASF